MLNFKIVEDALEKFYKQAEIEDWTEEEFEHFYLLISHVHTTKKLGIDKKDFKELYG